MRTGETGVIKPAVVTLPAHIKDLVSVWRHTVSATLTSHTHCWNISFLSPYSCTNHVEY